MSIKSLTYILIALLAFASCSHDADDDVLNGGVYGDDYVQLTLEIATGQTIHTRALEGNVAGTGNENKIYDIQVWAYNNADGANATPIGYAEMKNIGAGTGTETQPSANPTLYENATVTMQLFLPKEFMENTSSKIDLYFIANYRSIMTEAPSPVMTRNQLEALTFGGDYFGINPTTLAPIATTVEAGKGLPMSTIRKNLSLAEMLQVGGPLHLRYNETVLLKRAVSRIAFFFAKQKNMTAQVQINKIEINTGLLPDMEYVLPNQSNTDYANLPDGVTYSTSVCRFANANPANPLLSHNDIPEVEDPALLRSDCVSNGNSTKTAQQYVDFIEGKAAQATPEAVQVGYNYLRETGKKITGTIYYTYGGNPKSASFEMYRDQDFARNHTWVVYAYFLKEGLYVTPMVQPWDVGGSMKFFSKTSVQLFVDETYNPTTDGMGTFTYKLYNNGANPADWNHDWDNNYCAIAYGFHSGRPLYSPWLRLTTTSSNTLHIQTNNTNYGFVIYHQGIDTYTEILDDITIPAGTNVETHFYMVPKYEFNISNPPSRFVHVTLTEHSSASAGENDGGIENVAGRLPWNSILPGPQDHTLAQFYYVTPTEYTTNTTENGVTLVEYGH